jgi:hypothetical protein
VGGRCLVTIRIGMDDFCRLPSSGTEATSQPRTGIDQRLSHNKEQSLDYGIDF